MRKCLFRTGTIVLVLLLLSISIWLYRELTLTTQDLEGTRSDLADSQTQTAYLNGTLRVEMTHRQTAEVLATQLHSRYLTNSAREALETENPRLALALAYAAATVDTPVPPAFNMLAEIAYQPGIHYAVPTPNSVHSLALHPDSKLAITGGSGGTLLVWNVETGKITNDLSEVADLTLVSAVAFNADGSQFATGDFDGTILLWDTATQSITANLKGHHGTVYGLDFSPDGQWLVSGGGDLNRDEVVLWNLASNTVENRLTSSFHDLIFDVAFSPDGQSIVATGSWRYGVQRWEVASGEHLQSYDGARGSNAFEIVFSPDGTHFAVAFSGGGAYVYDTESGRRAHRFTTPSGHDLKTIAVNPEGSILALGDGAGDIVLWEMESGRIVQQFLGYRASEQAFSNQPVNDLEFLPNGRQLLSVFGSPANVGEVTLWDVESALIQQQSEANTYHFDVIAYSPDGMRAVNADADGNLRMVDLQTGKLLFELSVTPDRITALAFSPDNQYFMSGSKLGKIAWRDAVTGEVLKSITMCGEKINSLAIAANGKTFLSGSYHWMILHEMDSAAYIYTNYIGEGIVTSVAYSFDDKLMALGSSKGEIKIFERESGKFVASFQSYNSFVEYLVFSADGHYLAASSSYQGVRVWDMDSLDIAFTRSADGTRFTAIDLHPSEPLLLVAELDQVSGEDAQLVTWDMISGERFQILKGHSRPIYFAKFAKDNQQILSASSGATSYSGGRLVQDTMYRVWLFHTPSQLVQWVNQNRAIRDFTCDERLTYELKPLCMTVFG